MYKVGDKVSVIINTNDPDSGERIQVEVPQVVVTEVSIQRIVRPARAEFGETEDRVFNNPVGGVIARHPILERTYFRPSENLQFSYPRSTTVIGLDVDAEGKPITLGDLMKQVMTENAARLAAAPRPQATQAPAFDLTAALAASQAAVDDATGVPEA